MDKKLHQAYHGGLLRRLAENGIKLSGKKGDTWGKYFGDHREDWDRAMNILIEYTREFDLAHGTGLLSSLLEEIARQFPNWH